MILVSDGYFPDLEQVDLSDGNLSDPGALGLLVVADELSHQWNFYAAGFPNELAEGISTYTNALFIEVRHGREAYERAIAYCRGAWVASSGREPEFAIADPMVYSNARYRPVVFCKTPVALHALRERLGDEPFFEGFRRAFEIEDRKVDGFDRLRRGFEEATGEDLGWFFDQWFFRAGFPTLALSHEATTDGIAVTIEQTQAEDPYTVRGTVRVTCEDGSVHDFGAHIDGRRCTFSWKLPAAPRQVTIDPNGVLPARVKS
jgi:aminopeptidase N